MIAEVTQAHSEPHLRRLLVDLRHQRRCVGRRALDLSCDQLRAEGSTTLVTGWRRGLAHRPRRAARSPERNDPKTNQTRMSGVVTCLS